MVIQSGQNITAYAFYTKNGQGVGSLTVTVDVAVTGAGSLAVTAGSATLGLVAGWCHYTMTAATTVTLSGTSSPLTVTGLTPGLTYWMTLSAVTSVGTGHETSAVSVRTNSVADAPSNVTAASTGATSMHASWTASAYNGGSDISSYRVQYSTDPEFVTATTTVDVTGAAVDLTGLTTGETYYLRVSALNAFGSSSWADVIEPALIAAIPNTPAAPALSVPSTTSLSVTWTAPANNGDPISTYKVQYSRNASFTLAATVSTSSTSVTLNALASGSTYYVRVSAANSKGSSSYSSVSQILLATPPATVAAPSLTVMSTSSLKATWTAPASHGSAVSGYRVQYSTNASFTSAVTTIDTPTLATSYTITSLTRGTKYYVRIIALNAAGASAPGTASSATP